MNRRKLGRTGIEVSEIGFGAWAIGGGMWGGRRDDDARQTLARAHALGVNLFDTALVSCGRLCRLVFIQPESAFFLFHTNRDTTHAQSL